MHLTPATKGQLTKAVKTYGPHPGLFGKVREIFNKVMPREQAKHAARKFCAKLAR